MKNVNNKNKKKRVLTPERKAQMREYQRAHYDQIIKYQSDYKSNKLETDYMFYLENNIRHNISYGLRKKGWRSTSNIQKYVGCSYEQFVAHIESSWEPGMSWSNYGRSMGCWSIDHILPPSKAEDEAELKARFHFTNTRAMWQDDNIRKSNKENLSF